MKTRDLIDALATDLAPKRPLEAALPVALAAGLAGTAALFLAVWGVRPDIASALESLRFLAKPALALLLAATALGAALRLARPGAGVGGWSRALLAAPAAALALVAVELAVLPASAWADALVGDYALVCLVSIPLLSLPVLAALVAVLRRGAPLAPGLAGAACGLAAAGLGATFYAVYCVEDSPLFVATWYTLAAGIVAGIGALAGRRFLRW